MNTIHYFFRTSVEKNDFSSFGVIHLILLTIALTGIGIVISRKRENRLLELFIGIVFGIITLPIGLLIGGKLLVITGLYSTCNFCPSTIQL